MIRKINLGKRYQWPGKSVVYLNTVICLDCGLLRINPRLMLAEKDNFQFGRDVRAVKSA